MKRFIIIMFTVITLLAVSLIAESKVKPGDLPQRAQQFLSTNFKGINITKVGKTVAGSEVEYKVKLATGTEIEFNSQGVWKEIEASRGKTLPAAILPVQIQKYLSKHYSGETIEEVSHKKNRYKVELSNGKDLKFSESGELLSE